MPETHPSNAGPGNADPGLPLFYRAPRAIEAARHAGARFTPLPDYGFAATTNSVPIGAEEFYEAQAHYPIVFTMDEPMTAVAVLGLDHGRNLFVDGEGRWRTGCYIPAYVRRYPFVFIRSGDSFLLGIDESAASLSPGKGEPLFDGKEPSALTKRALDFCSAFQAQDQVVRDFAAALKRHDLLVPHRADLRAGSSEAVKSLSGFMAIDEKRLAALADETFLDWRRRGWIGLVYAHLLSMRRWSSLAALLERR